VTEAAHGVQALLDRCAIADVVSAYARAIDTRDWTALAACFTDDCVVEYAASGRAHGPSDVVDRCRSAVAPLDVTQHYVTNLVIDLAGDGASSVCSLAAQHVRGDGRFVVGGVYHDAWRRTPDGWRIAHRRLERTWTVGDRDVLALPDALDDRS
jgi:ketosteroid isomerase-like protein